MRQQKQLNAKTLWGRVIFWPLFLLAATPLVLAAPAHADDNTISIEVKNKNAVLAPPQSKNDTLYKATTDIEVTTGKPYGFNLTMQADAADLINSKDPTHKISAISSTAPSTLNVNQWGYALDKQANEFARVPAHNGTPAVIVDTSVKGKQADCNCKDQCATSVTFAANIDPTSLATGTYSATVTYTATAKPAPKPVVNPTVCRSGDPKNDCQVDIDPNMIPVKYTGSTTNAQWTSLANPEDSSNQGNWYNYNNKQWANAVTVKDPSKYKGKSMMVDQADVLGYWVYIPRYAYEVMRRDGTDKPVKPENFNIVFETANTPKKHPAKCTTGANRDYRTACNLDRNYPTTTSTLNSTTWATHPAFTFGTKELNGIWVGKFEATGSVQQPTVLPNEISISDLYVSPVGVSAYGIGGFYSVAKSLGVNDPQNVGGKPVGSPQNNHHLAKLSSHMVNNNDWGAATYLSASKYGAGYSNVQLNAQVKNELDLVYTTTGCGPMKNGSIDYYGKQYSWFNLPGNKSKPHHYEVPLGARGTQQACSSDGTHAYNATLGQLASTTNNPTGIYDMSGGGWEYVAASYSDNLNSSNTNSYFGPDAAHPPYVNTYHFKDFNSCTYQTCGGQALYETNNGTGGGSGSNQWNGQWLGMGDFALSHPWLGRGGVYDGGSGAGLFYVNDSNGLGGAYGAATFRVALISL